MKYILNKLPIKTTNSFNINDLKIDLELPNNLDFKEYSINNNDIDIKYSINDNFISDIGLEFNKYLNIDIKIDKIINEDIIFEYNFNNNDVLINNINIEYLNNSSSNIIFKYKSLDNNSHFQHMKLNINMNENSKANITIVNMLNDNSTNLVAINNIVNNNSNLDINLIDIGSKIKINNINNITNKNASSNLNNIYIGINDDIIDMNYNYINNENNSYNNIEVQGILNDHAKKKFRGTIDFIKGSYDSTGKESENTIILNDDVINSSVPILLCGEENVSGAHSVSSGKIDEDKLFYLESRGLTIDEAKRIICMTNLNKIIKKINNPSIQDEIIEFLNNKI